VISNVPYAIAKGLPKQPGKGMWIKPYEAVGSYSHCVCGSNARAPEVSFNDLERLRRIHGLDKPRWAQYLLFNKSIFTGEFGISLRWDQHPACTVFIGRLPATIQLASAAVLFSVLLGCHARCPRGVQCLLSRNNISMLPGGCQ
jgi:ABC-type dipeptide/oligopeptide/nickel transport system permease component